MEKMIDFDRQKFKKIGGVEIENIIEYIKNYVKTNDNIRIMVGCDSIQKKRGTIYALTIIFYDIFRHDGAHIIYIMKRTKKEKDLFLRMMNETMYSLELSEWLEDRLEGIYKKPIFEENEYDGSIPIKKIEIHVDINPEYGIDKRNKSHVAYTSIMGLLCSYGYSVKSKYNHGSFAATSAADHLLPK